MPTVVHVSRGLRERGKERYRERDRIRPLTYTPEMWHLSLKTHVLSPKL